MSLGPDVISAVEDGAIILASSKRLARVLTAEFAAHQRSRGRAVWRTPSILSWGGLLDRCWRERMFQGDGQCPVLLNATQELAVWADIIRQSPEGEGLLQVPPTARSVKQAWALIHEYRLPFREGAFAAREDTQAFYRWAVEFRRRRDEHGWLELTRLADVIPVPVSRVFTAGFDELTPQQRELLGRLSSVEATAPADLDGAQVRQALHDTTTEIRQAARWAREHLERNPDARIGVIVPKLDRLRPAIQRIFSYVLEPGAEVATPAFHISLGPALAAAPIVAAALAILELGRGDPTFGQIGELLRSPFLAGAETERSARALADAHLRRRGIYRAGLRAWREHLHVCPLFDGILRKLEGGKTDVMPYGAWSHAFSVMLKTVGWPGERPLSSHEYQTIRAWNDALSSLASLDLVAPPADYSRALDRLREIAATARFEPEDEGAPIQIMGLLEASGLQFDHLWVMGLDEEALPEPARPHPFLPLDLQRAHKLPHASPERELEFARKIVRRLEASAGEVVWSHPCFEGDTPLEPSPLVRDIESTRDLLNRDQRERRPDEVRLALPLVAVQYGRPGTSRDVEAPDWIAAIRASATFEIFTDPCVPPLPAGEVPSGGTRLLLDMAACPFRAWAFSRARARPLEEPEPGISSRHRGSAMHEALKLIWEQLRTQAALLELSAQELRALAAQHIRTALLKTPGIGRALEQKRGERLLVEWLELEKRREPFEVIEFEHDAVVQIGGMRINTRADRVDLLRDGQRIVLDYKTGEVKLNGWEGERLRQPQVPLYSVSLGANVAAAAFAQIRTGELGFRGLSEDKHPLPDMKTMKGAKVRFTTQVEQWRGVLERLGSDFCLGRAGVDPLNGACDFCGLKQLCRVYEAAAEAPADE